jgi:hypothetical protein
MGEGVMSVTAISRVFWTNISDLTYKDKYGKMVNVGACTCKIVLLAIADNSNDYGENSWQSFDTLATKSSLEKRSVMRAVKALCDNKYLVVNGISEYGTNNYAINMGVLGQQPPRRRRGASDAESLANMESDVPDASASDSGAVASDSGATTSDVKSPEPYLTIPEPSLTRALSPKDYEQVNKKVDAMIENSRRASWSGREKMPEPIRELLDMYVELTGQTPTKGKLMDWMATASEWMEIGIIKNDLQKAYERSREGNGFAVVRPGSLTATAGAFAGERRVKGQPSKKIELPPGTEDWDYIIDDDGKMYKKHKITGEEVKGW